jgi:hypothetical protein
VAPDLPGARLEGRHVAVSYVPPGAGPGVPAPALRGVSMFPAGSAAGGRVPDAIPGAVAAARHSRGLRQRAAGWPARPGIRQSARIGSGPLVAGRTREAARRAAGAAPAAHVDRAPLVMALTAGLLTGTGAGPGRPHRRRGMGRTPGKSPPAVTGGHRAQPDRHRQMEDS